MGHVESTCNKAGRHKKGKSVPIPVQVSPASSGLGPFAETAAVEH